MTTIQDATEALAALDTKTATFLGTNPTEYYIRRALQTRIRFHKAEREASDTEQIGALRREHTGDLPSHSMVGGYPLLYLDAKDNVLCPDCANEEQWDGQGPVVCDINYSSSTECEDCSQEIESAYGDDD